MQSRSLLLAAKSRLQPRRWAGLLVLLALLAVIRIFIGESPSLRELPHLTRAFLLALTLVALAPVPWQWTGDERRMASPLRGGAQALVWNLAWVGLLMAFFAPGRPLHLHPFGPGGDPVVVKLFTALHQHTRLPLPLVPVLGLIPLAFGVGWLVAAFQAAEGDRSEAVAGRKAMEVAAREAQEQALKAQLDPHVLYNALSGISELIREDPARAEEALVSLAEMYRKLTALGRRGSVSLGEERAMVLDYLAVEQVRLGSRLRVTWAWPEALDALQVPPLLVQPLVENAIKHGLAPRRGGGELRLSAAREGAGLRFQVANDGAPLDPAWSQGTGLANLDQRLALLGGGSRLELRRDGAWTVADLLLRPGEQP